MLSSDVNDMEWGAYDPPTTASPVGIFVCDDDVGYCSNSCDDAGVAKLKPGSWKFFMNGCAKPVIVLVAPALS